MKNLFKFLSNLSDNIIVALFITVIFSFVHRYVGIAVGILSLLIVLPNGVAAVNYTPSALAKAQAKLFGMFAAGELRAIDPVTYKAFRANSEIMIPSHKILRTREDRTLEAYYMVRSARALGTGRSHAPVGSAGNSGVLTPSFITYSDKFSISMKQADNNVFAFDEMFANEIANVLKNFSTGNEANATTYLFNNRSQVSAAVSEVSFNAVTFTHEINESTVGNRAMQIAQGSMAENLYGEMPATVFCDSISYAKFAFLAKQGTTNATNTSFQFEGMTFVRSLYLTAKAAGLGYAKGFWQIAPNGTIAVLDWIPKQNREGVSKPPYVWGSFRNPIDELDYALYSTYVAGDETAVNGYSQDLLTQYEFSQDLAFENAPLSTANESTIHAFALV